MNQESVGHITSSEELKCVAKIIKDPETEIGVPLEGLRSKAISHWILPLLQFKMTILPPGISE